MAGNANMVVLMGNLTRSPELRYTPQGRPVTTLNIAVNRIYKDRDTGESVKNTDFIPVSVWGVQAENCEKYLTKGRGVYVEGRILMNKWEDANGETRSKLEVVARNVQFLSSGGGESRNNVKADTNISESKDDEVLKNVDNVENTESDEVPF